MHGSLIEVSGLGMLILGPSGVGKSECVIELVRRGHRLVADDVVRLARVDGEDRLLGWSPEHIRHYVEIRGLGLLCVADLYGADSVLDECTVDFVCRLEQWSEDASYERIGLNRDREELGGVEVPMSKLPVHAASNTATLVELAARDWKLRRKGINAARRLDERLRDQGGILAGGEAEPAEGT